jgi:xanthine dehydrogenase accessory factor
VSLEFYEEVARRLRAGCLLAVATVIGRQGSAPRAAGARMIVTELGETEFSVGGGAFEALVIADAQEAIREGRNIEKEYRFTEKGDGATGMVCGGRVRVLIEVVRPPASLFVFGGGHVGREVARQAARLGFAVTVVDDREDYLESSRYPAGVRRIRVERDFSAGLPVIPPGAFVTVVTRCHRTDLAAVRHAVGRGAAYVGLIGSRRKIVTVLARAEELGSSKEALREVRAPIGLAIGAETPEEIAVSIAAEMIAVRHDAPMVRTSRAPQRRDLDAARSSGTASVTPIGRRHPARPRPVS